MQINSVHCKERNKALSKLFQRFHEKPLASDIAECVKNRLGSICIIVGDALVKSRRDVDDVEPPFQEFRVPLWVQRIHIASILNKKVEI